MHLEEIPVSVEVTAPYEILRVDFLHGFHYCLVVKFDSRACWGVFTCGCFWFYVGICDYVILVPECYPDYDQKLCSCYDIEFYSFSYECGKCWGETFRFQSFIEELVPLFLLHSLVEPFESRNCFVSWDIF